MSISDELTKLAALREQGILSHEEFEQAKKKVLGESGRPSVNRHANRPRSYRFEDTSDESVGKAANRYVSFQMIMAVIGIIIFLIFFAPIMCSSNSPFRSQPKINFTPDFP